MTKQAKQERADRRTTGVMKDAEIERKIEEIADDAQLTDAERSELKAAADIDLDKIADEVQTGPIRGVCPCCSMDPIKLTAINYELPGLIAGSVELYRMIVCKNCRAIMGMQLVNVSRPNAPQPLVGPIPGQANPAGPRIATVPPGTRLQEPAGRPARLRPRGAGG